MIHIIEVLSRVLKVLSANNKVIFPNKSLLNFFDSQLSTPIGNVLSLLIQHKSKLPDQPVDFECLKQLVDTFNSDQSIIRLNHIGFCYKVDSQENEKERLIDLIKQT
ncbi:MAG: hypothetical protein C0412_20255, partial [Flavobacterium sp.]|nr:hypothetical protein [Flavobacterium sp.]